MVLTNKRAVLISERLEEEIEKNKKEIEKNEKAIKRLLVKTKTTKKELKQRKSYLKKVRKKEKRRKFTKREMMGEESFKAVEKAMGKVLGEKEFKQIFKNNKIIFLSRSFLEIIMNELLKKFSYHEIINVSEEEKEIMTTFFCPFCRKGYLKLTGADTASGISPFGPNVRYFKNLEIKYTFECSNSNCEGCFFGKRLF